LGLEVSISVLKETS